MSDYQSALLTECDKHQLDHDYIEALIAVESGREALRTRYEPGFSYFENAGYWAGKLGQSVDTEMAGQKTSWGLMQVMGGTARHLGFSGYFPELCLPCVGIHFGCVLFSQKLKKYGGYLDAVSAYNAGTPVKLGDKYANQIYVDKVLRVYANLKT